MWSVTAGKSVGPGEFLAHRIIKIVPLYWLFTVIFVVGATLSQVHLMRHPQLFLRLLNRCCSFRILAGTELSNRHLL
ncbi:hypothetical protein [Rhizobium gallicum]|uniref:hypothetical protein n=1 Tax=Rhizobium gallicum TaxID=56730 RepID=UPI003AB0E5FA